MQEICSAVSAVAYRQKDNMIAVGHNDGSVMVWGSKFSNYSAFISRESA